MRYPALCQRRVLPLLLCTFCGCRPSRRGRLPYNGLGLRMDSWRRGRVRCNCLLHSKFCPLVPQRVHKRGNEEQRLSKPKSRLVQLVPLGACHPRRGCDRVLRRMRSCSSQCCCLAAAASCCHPRVWAVLASIAAYACTGRGIGGLIGPRCWMPRGRATVRSQGLRRKGVGGRGAVLVGGKGAVLAGLALPRGEARRGLGTVGRVSAMTSGCP